MPETAPDRMTRKQFVTANVHPKLRRSLRLYIAIALFILSIVVITTFRSSANPLVVLSGLIIGTLIGTLFSRVYKISWDKDAEKAVNKMDAFGVVLLALSIMYDLSREHLVSLFISGNSVGATSPALLAGLFYGRVLGTGHEIIKVVKSEKVLTK